MPRFITIPQFDRNSIKLNTDHIIAFEEVDDKRISEVVFTAIVMSHEAQVHTPDSPEEIVRKIRNSKGEY